MWQHNFIVQKGFDDITMLCCTQCGLSYQLQYHPTAQVATWRLMEVYDATDKLVLIATPCHERRVETPERWQA